MFDQYGNDAPNGFQYHIHSASGHIHVPVHAMTMVGHAHDMERGVLRIAQPDSGEVRYFPVQAIPQGMAKPDLVADVSDDGQLLTTLHFCVVYQVQELSAIEKVWRSVSFSEQRQALLYNDARLSLCPKCSFLHKYPCVDTVRDRTAGCPYPTTGWSLDQALVGSRMALCAHGGDTYLVIEEASSYKLYCYSISRFYGLQRSSTTSFYSLPDLQGELKYRGVPLFLGWQSVDTSPPVFPMKEKL